MLTQKLKPAGETHSTDFSKSFEHQQLRASTPALIQGSKWVAIERAKLGEYNATKIIKKQRLEGSDGNRRWKATVNSSKSRVSTEKIRNDGLRNILTREIGLRQQISTRERSLAFNTTKPALSIQRSPATVPLTNVDIWKCETKALHSQLSRSH
ncbi:arginine/serine-rich coiled-coil protein 2 [Dorcoceras hygrometricum]|uniref:Arginine/serine-rich coiled-coil protein 2 n=1 Tax=Dorcoceras hygrometricum TaxID=472368 RepID=A0A2Z7D2F2_9LAMI|nr:arginine/serine-rich coiled-coil protein 2 [Dorcoceras hygrometricum]